MGILYKTISTSLTVRHCYNFFFPDKNSGFQKPSKVAKVTTLLKRGKLFSQIIHSLCSILNVYNKLCNCLLNDDKVVCVWIPSSKICLFVCLFVFSFFTSDTKRFLKMFFWIFNLLVKPEKTVLYLFVENR